MEMQTELIQAVIDFVVNVLPILIALLGVWIVGRVTGLWGLVQNELVKRFVKQTLSAIVLESNFDEMAEVSLQALNDRLFERAESWLKTKGFNVELDELELIVSDVISDFFVYIDTVVEDKIEIEQPEESSIG